MRADRLLQILLILERSKKVTSRQLAEQLEVSERTVFRDMEALSAAGIPVMADRGMGGGWYLHEGYKTMLTDMNREDIQALLFPQLWSFPNQSAEKDSFARASRKLLAALPPDWRKEAEDVRRRIHVDGAGWNGNREAVQGPQTIQEAIWAGKKISFVYNRETAASERTISPLGLVIKGAVWYLVGVVENRKVDLNETGEASEKPSIRTYRVSRMSSVAMLEEKAQEAPPDFDLEAYWSSSLVRFKEQLPVYPAVLQVEAKMLPQLAGTRFVQVERTEETEEGPLRVHVRFDTLESAVSILLSFAGAVRAEAPEELLRGVRDAALKILEH